VARIRLDLDEETLSALMDRALRERRPLDWQAAVIIRLGLGLVFPYPSGPDEPKPKAAPETAP
jgi:hypothetical protein